MDVRELLVGHADVKCGIIYEEGKSKVIELWLRTTSRDENILCGSESLSG